MGYVSKYSFYLWLSPRTRMKMMWYQEVPAVEVREQLYGNKTGMEREYEHRGVLEQGPNSRCVMSEGHLIEVLLFE